MRCSNVSKRLTLLMQNTKTSQAELSRQTGISAPSLSRYVSGLISPTADAIVKISEVTGVNANWILGFGPDKPMEGV